MGSFWADFHFDFQICDFTNFFFGLYGLLILTFPFFLRCTTQLQLTAAHSTTAYRPQSFDEITQSVWSERYKYSKVFGFKRQIILKYSMKKTKKRLFWLRMYNWYLCSFCLDKTKWEGESWVSWESRQSFDRLLQENMPILFHTNYQLAFKDEMERTNLQKSVFHSNDYTNAISGVEKSLKIENVPMKYERFSEFMNSL